MRKSAIELAPLLLLVLGMGTVGCGSGGEALSPEAREIRDFLNDKHVNAVLWEEWNIFDEWGYAVSLYDRQYTGKMTTFEGLAILSNLRPALKARAVQNHQKLLVINIPQPLEHFWNEITEATHWFWSYVTVLGSPAAQGVVDRAYRQHQGAWLELKGICREHGINMEWPLPRQLPSSVGGGSGMPPIPGGGGENGGMPPIPSGGGGGGGGMPPIPVGR